MSPTPAPGSPPSRPDRTTRISTDTQANRAPPPTASAPHVRKRMQSQRVRDTRPELAVRRLLHAAGLRYRVDRPPLPGLRRRADIVHGPSRLAVFIDGCFWHGCPTHGNLPTANAAFWEAKLARNRERDADTDRRLTEAGWEVIRAWEHEDPADVTRHILLRAAARRTRPVAPGRSPKQDWDAVNDN